MFTLMGKYKGITIPDQLTGLIQHMSDLDQAREEISSLGQQWELLTILGQMTGSGSSMASTRESFRQLTEQLLGTLGQETLKSTVQSLTGQAQVTVDIVVRNLFERTADIGFLATDDDLRAFLKEASTSPEKKQALKARFGEYVAKYSVYKNVILLDADNNVVCSYDDDLKTTKSYDTICEEARITSKAFVEKFAKTDLNPAEEQSLIYAFRVQESSDPHSRHLGVLCLVFKFEDELEMVFKNLVKESDWCVLTLLDANGKVIASSDASQVPVNAKLAVDPSKEFAIIRYAGRLYLCKTCATQGYQGYFGLGWQGHAMIPVDQAFNKDTTTDLKVSEDALAAITNNKALFSDSIREIPLKADRIQSDLERTVWNGNVTIEQANSDNTSNSKKVLLWEISSTGQKTKSVFEKSIAKLHETAVNSIFSDATFSSALAIDIMDRNLYERANDCRWWALTTSFRRLLAKEYLSEEDLQECTAILSYINGLYTVYSNIFLYDLNGKIIAVSKPSETHHIGKVLQDSYIVESLRDPSSHAYSVSPFEKTVLYDHRATYIYASSIADLTNPQKVVGGIGIVFDSEPQFLAMLQDSLPKASDGSVLTGHHALFVDRDGVVVASTNQNFPAGTAFTIPLPFDSLMNGESAHQIVNEQDVFFAVGLTCSHGYREYKSPSDAYRNDVFGVVMTELGVKQSELANSKAKERARVSYNEHLNGEATKEFASFYIGDTWLGFEKSHVVECVELGRLTPMPGTSKAILGTIIFKGQPICVVNASELVGGKKKELSTSSQVIVLKMEKGLIGLLVEELGEIPEVPSSFIVNASDCGHMDNEAIEYIIKPPPSAPANKIMLALNPSHFLTSVVSEKTMKQLAQISQNQTKNQSQSKSQIELKATVNE